MGEGGDGAFESFERFVIGGDNDDVAHFSPPWLFLGIAGPVVALGGLETKVGKNSKNGD